MLHLVAAIVSAAAAQLSKIDGLGSTGSSDPFSWRCSICFRGATVLHSSDANERITSRPDRAQPNRRSDTDNDDKNNGAVSRPARSDPFRPERLDRSVVSRAANKQLFCSINMSCAIDAAARLLRCYLNSSLRRMQIRRAPGATHTASGRICAPAQRADAAACRPRPRARSLAARCSARTQTVEADPRPFGYIRCAASKSLYSRRDRYICSLLLNSN